MTNKNRIILKTSEIFGNFSYPEQSWSVPSWVALNDDFIDILKDIISCNINDSNYKHPDSFDELFSLLKGKNYAVFEERFIVCLSQGRLSYLINSGFTKVSATPDLFELENWMIKI